MDKSFGPFGSESAYVFHELIKECSPDESGRKKFEKGDIIFREGMYPVGLFCVIKGKVKVSRLNEDGREQIVRLYGPGDMVGYKSLIMEVPYHASAQAIEDSELGFVSKSAFDDKIVINARISRQLMKILCENLEQSENLMVSLASKNIRERVAGVLVQLVDKFGSDDNGILSVQLSREEIAGMIGIATENLSRALTQFREEGFINTIGRRIAVLDRQGLVNVRGEL